jgi:hypothetical protein
MTMHGFRATAGGGLALALTLFAVPAAAEPMVFDSPETAVASMVDALEANDRPALVAIFGPENEDLILSGNAAEDGDAREEFLASFRMLNRLTVHDDGRATLVVGRDLWPFPIELEQGASGWSFDVEGGREELLYRRIGLNELDVIDLMRGYVHAQARYRAMDPDGDGLPSFAAAILSDPGRRDGLYWPDAPGAPESPVGDFMARAAADGYSLDGVDVDPDPYHGYYFRVLTRQGAAAPGGALDYMVGDHLLAGHALLAFPAAYGESGVMSFMVGEAGIVYEADLGEDTLAVAGAIESFDPGEGWAVVAEE